MRLGPFLWGDCCCCCCSSCCLLQVGTPVPRGACSIQWKRANGYPKPPVGWEVTGHPTHATTADNRRRTGTMRTSAISATARENLNSYVRSSSHARLIARDGYCIIHFLEEPSEPNHQRKLHYNQPCFLHTHVCYTKYENLLTPMKYFVLRTSKNKNYDAMGNPMGYCCTVDVSQEV